MADTNPGLARGRLDATEERPVVYCHQCENEWWQHEHGLTCPRCDGEVTEIISPESDPRPIRQPSTPPDFRTLRGHNPWDETSFDDPEEADIEEHIEESPNGSVFITRTTRSFGGGARGQRGADAPDVVMRDFQQMLSGLIGPNLRAGEPGRSGPQDIFPPITGSGFRIGSNGSGIVGGRFTYTSSGTMPGRDDRTRHGGARGPPEDIATYDPHPSNGRIIIVIGRPDQIVRLLGNIFGTMGANPGGLHDGQRETPGGMPMGLQGLFASLLNPANARHGDAVYSQEALDQIISQLMEQHPSSNAPGPASPDAIAALPKKKLDETMLGPEGKGECSVCMDDVHIGDEVVALPCSHWFHEACASMWLGEHNTCPICRKGIEGENRPSNSRRSSQNAPPTPSSRNQYRVRRASGRDQARLNSIRNLANVPVDEEERPRRWQVVGNSETRGQDADDDVLRMPGSFRRRDSEMSVDNQRDSRRAGTSGSDRSRESRRSSQSGNGDSGPLSWLRNRFSGNGGSGRRDS